MKSKSYACLTSNISETKQSLSVLVFVFPLDRVLLLGLVPDKLGTYQSAFTSPLT